MLSPSCTAAVQHHTPQHAPQPCNTAPAVMHGNRATSQTFETDDLARFFVQHQPSFPAPQPCKVSCTVLVQHRKTEPTYVGTDNRTRHALACKTVKFIYRNSSTDHLNQLNHRGNQQTARAERGAGHVR